MSDRLVTALGALAALALFVALLSPGMRPPETTRPTTLETGPNGYAALARWLEADGVPVHSLRTRVHAIAEDVLAVPAAGNILITTLPHRHRLRRAESHVLRRWIRDGNTLLIMAALDDTPDWSLDADTAYFLEDLERLTDLGFGAPEEDAERRRIGGLTEAAVTLEGITAHPLMSGVERLQGVSDFPAAAWEASREEDDHRALLRLARESGSGADALWQVPYGNGHMIVSALGSPLTNRAIGEADNRVFVANLLNYHLTAGAGVIFDDMHQGLSDLYDPEAFFSDARLGATLLFVLGFWALYVVGSDNRLAPLREPRRLPSQTGFVAGVGGFLARKLSPAEAGRLMISTWLDELRRRGTVPRGEGPPWQDLAALSAVDGERVERLRRHHEALARGRKVDLKDVHNTIEELRRMLR